MKFARSIFSGRCPEPPKTKLAARHLVEKICLHYERLRTGGTMTERTLDGFRIEYNVIAANLTDFIRKNEINLSLQEIRDDTHHIIFAVAIPIHAYISGLGLLLKEALKLNIYETNNRLKHETLSETQRNVISTLLCQIGWHGLSKMSRLGFFLMFKKLRMYKY
jgi:hypothetical protein